MNEVDTKRALKLIASRLTTLSGILDKAERGPVDQSADESALDEPALDELAAARLAGDMHPLSWQIAATCMHANAFLHWSRGGDLANAVIGVQDWAEARAVLAETRSQIAEAIAACTGAPDDKRITIAPMGLYLDLPAQRYLDDWVLPNFYFHLTTAYAILRMKGVGLGKADFLSHIAGELRPIPAEAVT